MSDTHKKDHADFQDPYRRSSNFGKDDRERNAKGDGTIREKKNETMD
jgi:hypothetical protein